MKFSSILCWVSVSLTLWSYSQAKESFSTTATTGSTGSTGSSSSSSSTTVTNVRHLVNEFENSTPYPEGTRVYHFSENAWYSGTITKYFDGVYTVTWDDDESHEYFDNLKVVDAMVRNAEAHANVDLYDMGTHVKDGDDRGIIVDFADGKYRVEWNDGSVEVYRPGSELDAMVAQAMQDVVTAQKTATQPPQATQATQATQDQALYPMGTHVKTGNNRGTIVDFVDGMYRVKWSDGATRSHSPGESLDRMVAAAAGEEHPQQESTQPKNAEPTNYPVGTHVKQGVNRGTIIEMSDGKYRVRWSDGTTKMHSPGQEFDAMVAEAALDEMDDEATLEPTYDATSEGTFEDTIDGDDDAYDIGTEVYKYFPGKGFIWGAITWFSDGVFEIKWEDGTVEQYDDADAIAEMVQLAERTNEGDEFEDDPWENGIAVFKNFDGEGAFFGKITNYQNGMYTVRWSDGSLEQYSIDETDAMVQAAYEQVRGNQPAAMEESSLGAGSKFMLVVVVMAGIISAGFIVKRRRTGIEKDSDTTRNQNIAPAYTDDPIKDDVTASDAEPPMDVPDII